MTTEGSVDTLLQYIPLSLAPFVTDACVSHDSDWSSSKFPVMHVSNFRNSESVS